MNNGKNAAGVSGLGSVALIMCVLVLLLCGSLAAQSPAGNADGNPARYYFTDVELVDQNGKTIRFYSDLLKDKVVIINAFFTTCTSVCPPMTHNIGKIQDWLGNRLAKDVHIISMSVDPETDTPPRLKDYAQKFNAKPGWYFVAGKKENVALALRKVGQYVDARDDHTTIIIVGNLRTGLWKKAFGLAKPEDLIKVVDSVLNDRGENAK